MFDNDALFSGVEAVTEAHGVAGEEGPGAGQKYRRCAAQEDRCLLPSSPHRTYPTARSHFMLPPLLAADVTSILML